MTSRRSPTMRRRRLGIELRRLREAAGVTIDVVAERLECSSSKVSRIETGHIGASPRDVRDILDILEIRDERAEDLIQVAREAKQKGWWHPYGQVLTGAYVGLEAAAARIRAYEAQLVPGLLQTKEYTQAVIRAARPDISPEELDRRIRVRTTRQSLITQNEPLDLWVILDEAALIRLVGDATLMRVQLDKLVEMAERPNVTLQVLPFSTGAHAGMDGTFAILEYDDEVDPDVVFAENAAGGLFLEKEEELRRYQFVFNHLRASALPPTESVEKLAARAKELQ